MSDNPKNKKYKVAFDYPFSIFDCVIWNGNEWYFNTFLEIKRFLAKYDKYCKIKTAEIRLIETNETIEIWHFDTSTDMGNLVIKEVVE